MNAFISSILTSLIPCFEMWPTGSIGMCITVCFGNQTSSVKYLVKKSKAVALSVKCMVFLCTGNNKNLVLWPILCTKAGQSGITPLDPLLCLQHLFAVLPCLLRDVLSLDIDDMELSDAVDHPWPLHISNPFNHHDLFQVCDLFYINDLFHVHSLMKSNQVLIH